MNPKMNPTKYYSSIQEHRIADYLGWHVVTGSGSRSGYPGDISSDEWLGECKTHISPGKKIEFKLNVWSKISDEATSRFKLSALFVDDGSQKLSRTWVLFDYTVCGLSDDAVTCYSLNSNDQFKHLSITNNFIFDHFNMIRLYQSIAADSSSPILLTLNTKMQRLCTCPVSTFNDLFHT